jgi:hypothetical protein
MRKTRLMRKKDDVVYERGGLRSQTLAQSDLTARPIRLYGQGQVSFRVRANHRMKALHPHT